MPKNRRGNFMSDSDIDFRKIWLDNARIGERLDNVIREYCIKCMEEIYKKIKEKQEE